jgi:hypothetical protein
MKYFYLEPEVAGGLGDNTVMDRSKHPPIVHKLHYDFDGWLGDALLESFPCFITTVLAKEKLQLAEVTGVKFQSVEVTTSEEFRDFYPNRKLPDFAWMQVEGIPRRDDFGVGPDSRLIVSDRALQILREIGIPHAKVKEL